MTTQLPFGKSYTALRPSKCSPPNARVAPYGRQFNHQAQERGCAVKTVGLHPTFSRHGIAQSLSTLGELIWLNEKVGVHPTFSRHGIAQSLSALGELIWLDEKVGFHPTFSRHGIAQILSALALLIWLDEKVRIVRKRGCDKT